LQNETQPVPEEREKDIETTTPSSSQRTLASGLEKEQEARISRNEKHEEMKT